MHKLTLPVALVLSLITTVATAQAGEAYVVLVDKSGSMEGAKMTHTKAALVAAFERLDDDDRVAIIAFDDTPVILLADGSPASAIEAIERLKESGGTDIQPAMEAGYELIEAIGQTHDDLEARHMIVMTDGQASWGTIDVLSKQIHADGITISTVALGHDADTTLLDMIADNGGGVATVAQNTALFEIAIVSAFEQQPMPEDLELPDVAPASPLLVLILDVSASRREAAVRVARAALDGLDPETARVAIIQGTDAAHTLLDDGSLADALERVEKLDRSTRLDVRLDSLLVHTMSVLRDVENQRQRSDAARLLIVSDSGATFDEKWERILQSLHADDVVVSTIALGTDADIERLEQIARLGGGVAIQLTGDEDIDTLNEVIHNAVTETTSTP